MSLSLNEKQKLFAQYKIEGLSNKEAAIKAGYSEKTASQQGAKLARNKKINAYINFLNSKNDPVKKEMKIMDREESNQMISDVTEDPLEFLRHVMKHGDDMHLQVEAAKAILPYEHGKKPSIGIKEGQKDRAKELSKGGGSGRFTPPGIKVVK